MVKRFPEVPIQQLRACVDPESLPFDNTASLETPEERIVGQQRAGEAVKFGMGIKADNYHIYIAGPSKAGLTYTAKTYLEQQAGKQPSPPDLCYVHNFSEPDRPRYLKVSTGRGKELKKDMSLLTAMLQSKIPEVFESDDFSAKSEELRQRFESKRRDIISTLSEHARQEGFILQISQVGMVIIPASKAGRPMPQEELTLLSDEEKDALRQKSETLQEQMKDAVKKIRREEEEFRQKQSALKKQVALYVVGHEMDGCFEKYKVEAGVVEYLKAVRDDIVENIDDFTKKPDEQTHMMPPFAASSRESVFRKYDVNVLVDNTDTKGAPVVIESNPTYPNLFGIIERQAFFGALFTDFTMIKPGVLHKANGGYLVMKALDLLKWYLSWEALKRALRDHEIRIEDLGELYGIFSTRTIRPEPIPLDIKIVLTGDPYLFELLHYYDERFPKLFKVKAHMDDRMDRSDTSVLQLARMIGSYCSDQNIRHLDKSGVARILEYSMERTEDQSKLTLELGDIGDLIQEANYFAGLDHRDWIQWNHVEEAVRKRVFRSNLIEERIRELVETNVSLIETDGARVGQINGLSILLTGDYEFGKPSRITATVSVGREGVVAIERESKMSGRIHTKGVMILTGFLKERFAHNKPLSLSAALCFEQSYGLVEGDSASCAELFALLSALADVAVDQGIAVTGSVSQKGEVQAVGGVTRKVEAFFDVCRLKGFTGGQGVIIPSANIRNLMLKNEVVDAAKNGRFHVWAVSTVEEGIEILTGLNAGKIQSDGRYTKGSLFRKVDERLLQLNEIAIKFSREEENRKSRNSETG
jgi:lon-related putative ATP-dependent protease